MYWISLLTSFAYAVRVISWSMVGLSAHYAQVKHCIAFWGASAEAERIFKLQKMCLRNIFELQSTNSCKDVFNKQYMYNNACRIHIRVRFYFTWGTETAYLWLPQTIKALVKHLKIYQKQLNTHSFKKQMLCYLNQKTPFSADDFFFFKSITALSLKHISSFIFSLFTCWHCDSVIYLLIIILLFI